MMNNRFMSKVLWLVVFVCSALQVAVRAEPEDSEKKREVAVKREAGKDHRPEKRAALADMSAADKEAMRKALQAVWENPEVMQARDEVKRATETFHKAIRKAVGKENPRIAVLVEKMHGGGKSRDWGKKRPGPGPEGRGGRPPMGRALGTNDHGPGAAGDGRGIGPAGFMAFPGKFSEEEKTRLEQARKIAMESEGFRQVQQDLRILLKQGEELRKKRVEMFHRTRAAMARAMIEADPEIKPLLERIEKGRKGR